MCELKMNDNSCQEWEMDYEFYIGEGLVRGVDTRSGAAVCEWSGHKSAVLDLAVTDTMAVTTSDDGTARVWDLRVNRQ